MAKWSNNVPCGDIFILDRAFFPCSVRDSHWTCAVTFMNEKWFGTMNNKEGVQGRGISNNLIKYIKFEWKSRKRIGYFPGLSVDDVNDVTQQGNGCNCGVFT